MVDIVNALVTVSGASARAKSSAACKRRWRVSRSSKHTFSISYVHPPGPGELPEGALDKHCENATGSSTTSVGLLAVTLGAISRTCSCGLRRCSSANVSNVPGASVAPVKACRARDTWPCFTVARCLPASFLFRIFLVQGLGGILAASHPEPAAVNGMAKFFQKNCPLTPHELVGPLQQLNSTDAADPFWFVQQHCRCEAERFPSSLFSDPVANQLRDTAPAV